jgi:UTP-glucose-1-phosphate uridylyltransferase
MAHYTFVRQTEILGTAHAIAQVQPRISDEYFIVIFGDAIYPPQMLNDLLKKFAEVQKPIVCVHEVPREDVHRYGVVKLDGDRILEIVEQPKVEDAPSNLVCNGVYLLPKSIFSLIEKTPINAARNEYLLPDTLNLLMQEQDVRVLQVDPFWDI